MLQRLQDDTRLAAMCVARDAGIVPGDRRGTRESTCLIKLCRLVHTCTTHDSYLARFGCLHLVRWLYVSTLAGWYGGSRQAQGWHDTAVPAGPSHQRQRVMSKIRRVATNLLSVPVLIRHARLTASRCC